MYKVWDYVRVSMFPFAYFSSFRDGRRWKLKTASPLMWDRRIFKQCACGKDFN